jgi:hypothetical protein
MTRSNANKLQKWNIGVISTILDLKNERDSIKEFLESNGFNAIMSGDPKYEVFDNVDNVKNCLMNVAKMDVVILLIYKRNGCKPPHEGEEKTITQMEYEEALRLNKPVIKIVWGAANSVYCTSKEYCIRNNKKYDGKKFHSLVRESLGSECSRDEQNEFMGLMSFLNSICSDKNHEWMLFSDFTAEDLHNRIINALGWPNLTLNKLMVMQEKKVSEMDTGCGYRVSDIAQVFVEPSVKPDVKNDVMYYIYSNSIDHKNTQVIGGPGSGKTSVLLLSYLKHVKSMNGDSPLYPILVKLPQHDFNKIRTKTDLINELCAIYLKKRPHPTLDCENSEFAIYVDSVDEAPVFNDQGELVKTMRKLGDLSDSLALSCRKDQKNMLLGTSVGGITLEIDPLDEVRANTMADKYCNLMKKDEGSREKIRQVIKEQGINNPLLISLVVSLIEADFVISGDKGPLDKGKLYQKLSKRTIQRNLSNSANQSDSQMSETVCVNILRFASWKVHKGILLGSNIRSTNLLMSIREKFGLDCKDGAIKELMKHFITFDNVDATTVHYHLIEYCVAEWIIEQILNENGDEDFLDVMIGSEVQRFMGYILANYSDIQVENVYSWYVKTYTRYKEENNAHGQTNILYYIPRLTELRRTEINRKIKSFLTTELSYFEGNKDYLKMIPILIWLIQTGDFRSEEKYHKLLNQNKFARINRGCYMLYLGDYPPTSKLPDCIKKNDKGEWNRTFFSLRDHFNSDESRHKYLRRTDLQIIRGFIESKHVINKDIAMEIRKIGNGLEDGIRSKDFLDAMRTKERDMDEFIKDITEEYKRLLSSIPEGYKDST